jgi:site-specific DNA-methyltransferase (adenine-specific)
MIQLFKGDCLEIMKSIPDKSIDAIITDPPYGTTACKWDSVIPFDLMWQQLNRIIKPNGAIVLFGSEPFSSALRMSNIKGYCYDWIYDKKFGGNFVQAKRQPIKTHENISVFSIIGKMPIYSPQMIKRDVPIKKGGNKQSKTIPIAITEKSIAFEKEHKSYDVKFPDSQLHYSCRTDRGLHPTQKPVELIKYLIKTYTNENETVLDFTMGSGTTGVACKNLNRKFIGIEMDDKYFSIAENRIKNHIVTKELF